MTADPLVGRRLLIVEDDPNGHRLVYVRHLVEHASAAGAVPMAVVTPNVRASEQWRLHLEPLQDLMGVHVVDTTDLAGLVRVTGALDAEHTIVADGDHLAMRLGVVGRWRGTGTLTTLLMRDPDDEVPGTVKRRVVTTGKSALLWRARRVGGVHVVGLRSALARPSGVPGIALDPIERHADAHDVKRIRSEWEVRDDRFWYGVVGAVSARKNLPLVAEAVGIVCAAGGADAVGLLVAGPCQDGVLRDAEPHFQRLRALGAEVVVVDRVLGAVDFDAAACVVDCLVAAHSNEGPSAVVARAGLHGVRVVAAGAHSLARDVERLPVAAWSELDASALATALQEMRASQLISEPLDLGTTQFCEALLRPLYEQNPTTDDGRARNAVCREHEQGRQHRT